VTPADRIAALEAELAEAHKRIADMEAHDARWMSRHDDAQSALAFEKSAHARTQAEAAALRKMLRDGATFLRSARRHLEGTAVEGTPWFDGLVHITGVLFNVAWRSIDEKGK
jgi:predicted  nucleic acid-binding Zn-ribbon protein